MTNEDFCDELWSMAKVKDAKGKWKSNQWPIIRTGRGDLERAWSTMTKGWTEEAKLSTLNAIELALPELARARSGLRNSGGFMPQPVGIGRFLRDKRWLDCEEFGTVTEMTDQRVCVVEGCKQLTYGPRFCFCEEHMEFVNGRLRATLNLVPELRRHYDEHPELQGLTGKEAIEFTKRAIKNMLA